ncbi:MAG: hypothetical protein LBT47_12930, partial [Deltaproteobacteria bacterium]|nr:hypothetical protein [Deltaproteobacteria bacterium]
RGKTQILSNFHANHGGWGPPPPMVGARCWSPHLKKRTFGSCYLGGHLDLGVTSAFWQCLSQQELLQKLIIGICTDHDNAAQKFYDTGGFYQFEVFHFW